MTGVLLILQRVVWEWHSYQTMTVNIDVTPIGICAWRAKRSPLASVWNAKLTVCTSLSNAQGLLWLSWGTKQWWSFVSTQTNVVRFRKELMRLGLQDGKWDTCLLSEVIYAWPSTLMRPPAQCPLLKAEIFETNQRVYLLCLGVCIGTMTKLGHFNNRNGNAVNRTLLAVHTGGINFHLCFFRCESARGQAVRQIILSD